MYAPVSVIGYSAYGNSLHDSIIPSLQVIFLSVSSFRRKVNVLELFALNRAVTCNAATEMSR